MNIQYRNFVLLLSCVPFLVVVGCNRSSDNAKNASESTEFFKEIGSVEQENAEFQTSMDMQNAVVQPSLLENPPSPEMMASPEKPTPKDIQIALKNANIYQGSVDGLLGPKTKRAIETFQTQHDLKSDGKVGPKTWQKLRAYLNSSSQSSASTPLETSQYSSASNSFGAND